MIVVPSFRSRLSLVALLLAALLCGFISAHAQPLAQPAEPPVFEDVLAQAQQGDIQSQLTVGTMYEERGSYTNAVRWYQKAADAGNAGGQFKLGLLHAQGAGIPRDMTAAVKWFQQSATQGFPAAQYNLGVCWERGLGTPERNYAEALKWYRLAAEQSDPFAQKAVGVFHEKGLGVKADPAEAYKWYALAAANGYADGETLRKNLAAKFKPEELVTAQKRFTDYVAAKAANSAQPPPRLPVEAAAKSAPKAKTKDFLD